VGPCPFKPRAITLEIHPLPSGGVDRVGVQSTTCDVPVQQEMAAVVSLGNAPHVPKMMHLPHT